MGQTPTIKVRPWIRSQIPFSQSVFAVVTGKTLWGHRHDKYDVAARTPGFKRSQRPPTNYILHVNSFIPIFICHSIRCRIHEQFRRQHSNVRRGRSRQRVQHLCIESGDPRSVSLALTSLGKQQPTSFKHHAVTPAVRFGVCEHCSRKDSIRHEP